MSVEHAGLVNTGLFTVNGDAMPEGPDVRTVDNGGDLGRAVADFLAALAD